MAASLMAVTAIGLSGCQGVLMREPAQVRVVQASPDAPPIDLYMGDEVLAYHLAFGTRTSYVPVHEGTYMLHADASGTRQALGLSRTALVAGHQYTALVGNTLGNLQVALLPDQSTPAPAGEASLRIVQQATRSGAVDVYLVPSGNGVQSASLFASLSAPGLGPGSVPAYRNIPSGTYSLAVLPSGVPPDAASASLFTSPQMKLPSGSARTVVLLDRLSLEVSAKPSVQAIVNEEGEAQD